MSNVLAVGYFRWMSVLATGMMWSTVALIGCGVFNEKSTWCPHMSQVFSVAMMRFLLCS